MPELTIANCLFCNGEFTYIYTTKKRRYCSWTCGVAYRYDAKREHHLELRAKTRRKKGILAVGTEITITCEQHGEPHTYEYRGGKRRLRCQPNSK